MIKTLPKSHFIPLDREEEELIEALDDDHYVRDEKSDSNVARLSAILRNMREERRKTKALISIRTNTTSLTTIKTYAQKVGIPYQTILNAHIDMLARDIESGKISLELL